MFNFAQLFEMAFAYEAAKQRWSQSSKLGGIGAIVVPMAPSTIGTATPHAVLNPANNTITLHNTLGAAQAFAAQFAADTTAQAPSAPAEVPPAE